MDFSLENMCRTCMNEEGQMFSVFSQENRGITKISYADMLMACASLHVFRNDDLPQNICQHCLKHLSIAYSFKQQSERSEATLREITKNPNIEFIKEEIYDPYIDSNDEDFKTNGCQNILSKNSANKSVQHEYEPQKLLKLQNQMNEFKTEFLEDEFHLEHEKIAEDVNIGYEMSRTNNYEAASDNTAFLDDNILVNNVLSHDYSENSNKMYEIDEKPILKPESLKFKAVQRLIRELKCPYCNQIFKSQQAFKKHKKNHAKKLLKCEICYKEFRSSHGLRYHMKIHNGIKNYVCTFESCTRRFRLKQALDKHLSIHNNEKNHLCNMCGKTYCTYDALYYHLKAHRGERPYLCIHCGKTFKQSCHLKAHMWVHDGIKRHVCGSCGKCYTSGHQLKKHIKKHCPPTNNQNVEEKHVIKINVDQINMNQINKIDQDTIQHEYQINAGHIDPLGETNMEKTPSALTVVSISY